MSTKPCLNTWRTDADGDPCVSDSPCGKLVPIERVVSRCDECILLWKERLARAEGGIQ